MFHLFSRKDKDQDQDQEKVQPDASESSPQTPPRVLIFGAGGLGIFHAFIFHKSGADVTLVCRSNFDAVTEHGISMDSEMLGHQEIKIPAMKSPADDAGPWDYLVVCTRVNAGNPEIIKPAVSKGTTIVLLQNGIEIEEPYRQVFPKNAIITAAVYVGAEQSSSRPGHIDHPGSLNKLELGTYPAKASSSAKESVESFADMIRKGGGTADVCEDVQWKRWLKVIVNITWGSLCSLTLLDSNNLERVDESWRDIMKDTVMEIMTVAAAKGHTSFDVEGLKALSSGGSTKMKGTEPLMLRDVRNGRQMEIEPTLGNVVRIARSLKVEVPGLELLYLLLKGLNRSLALNGKAAQVSSTVGMGIE